MTLRFGTDGVRGPATRAHRSTGRGAGPGRGHRAWAASSSSSAATRASRARASSAPCWPGWSRRGLAVEPVGVVPTPVVAWICAERGVAGAMISASHNAFGDNGIKFFAPGGLKLTDAVEADLEARARPAPGRAAAPGAGPADLDAGARRRSPGGRTRSRRTWTATPRRCVDSLEGRRLDGLRVVIDCANGAASEVAPAVAARARAPTSRCSTPAPTAATSTTAAARPIPADLQAAVVAAGADVGPRLRRRRRPGAGGRRDGRAGRRRPPHRPVRPRPARPRRARRRHRGRHGHDQPGVPPGHGRRTASRWSRPRSATATCSRRSRPRGLSLGGEQSGHVIFRRLATTGDGLLTGVQLLDLAALGRPARSRSWPPRR